MIVMKFGGSSLESATAIQRVASIVRDHVLLQPAVVVSAMGKTTDRLLAIARLAGDGNLATASRETEALIRFHLVEASQLTRGAEALRLDRGILALFDEFREVLREIERRGTPTPRLVDAVSSFGERLSSLVVAAGLRLAGVDAVHLDAREVIVTDGRHTQAAPLFIETNALLRRRVSTDRVTVMGGFIGATEDGVVTTLGRGGSDYTAAIVGAALAADEIQIWTDVDGMLTCDPRIFGGAHCLRSISFAEAEQMAKSGAKVLHPATVAPAVRQRIPIAIRNSRNPRAAGTRIVPESPCDGAVMSIACRTALALVRLRPRTTPVTADFSREIWDVFQTAGIPIEPIATSHREISVAVERALLKPECWIRLTALADIGIEDNRALIALVGQNAARNSSNLARASQQLCRLPGGAIMSIGSDSRVLFAIAADSMSRAVEALHEEFFGQPNPAFFVPNRVSATTTFASAPAYRPDRAWSALR
jgi:aspartate kinase